MRVLVYFFVFISFVQAQSLDEYLENYKPTPFSELEKYGATVKDVIYQSAIGDTETVLKFLKKYNHRITEKEELNILKKYGVHPDVIKEIEDRKPPGELDRLRFKVQELEKENRILNDKLGALENEIDRLKDMLENLIEPKDKAPIIWSGFSTKGKKDKFFKYKTDRVLFNTAEEHFRVNPNGNITFIKDGYYKINLWLIVESSTLGHIMLLKNGVLFHHGHFESKGSKVDNYANVTWNFKKDDMLSIELGTSGGHWTSYEGGEDRNLLQIQYIGPLTAQNFEEVEEE